VTLTVLMIPGAAGAAGQWDTQFGLAGLADAAPDDIVWEFWLYDNDLYVVGEFTHIGGVPAQHIARWDGIQWHSVGGASFINTNSSSAVYTMIEYEGNLVVSGEFTSVNGMPGDVAVWDGASWSTIDLGVYDNGNGDILSLATDGSSLYVGGRFSEKVVEWDGATVTPLVTSWTGQVSAPVYAIHYFEGNLYAGGIFDSFNGVAMNNVGRWDGNQWNVTPPGLEWAVTELFDYDGSLYSGVAASSLAYPNRSINRWTGSQWVPAVSYSSVGGCAWALHDAVFFKGEAYQTAATFNNETSEPLYGVARWHDGSWDDMHGGVAATGGTCTAMGALFEYDGRLLVAGSFGAAGGMPATNMAEWTGNGWYTFAPDDRVTALENTGGNTYVGGDFLNAYDVPAPHIARWDGAVWHVLGSGLDGGVKDIQAIGSDIYVCGDFTDAGGSGAAGIARWDGSSWSALGAAPQLGTVETLASDGTNLYAGGNFILIGGVVAKRVAMWDGTTWHALGDGMNDGTVNALLHDGTTLYAAGDFVQAGAGITGNAATWNGTAWTSMDGGFDAPVYCLALHQGALYAGGEIDNANASTFLHHIARWNGTGWVELVGAGTNGVDAPVRTLVSTDQGLVAGGDFTTAGGVAASHIALWDGAAWTDLDGGTNTPVLALTSVGNDLFVGGDFVSAGGNASHKFGRWSFTATGAQNPVAVSRTRLDPPYPNPFNPLTTIAYAVAEESRVSIVVYSVDGKRVRTLVEAVQAPTGLREITWDGTDDAGIPVSSGVYYVRMAAAGETHTHKLVLLK
jgi:hypothetical protein